MVSHRQPAQEVGCVMGERSRWHFKMAKLYPHKAINGVKSWLKSTGLTLVERKAEAVRITTCGSSNYVFRLQGHLRCSVFAISRAVIPRTSVSPSLKSGKFWVRSPKPTLRYFIKCKRRIYFYTICIWTLLRPRCSHGRGEAAYDELPEFLSLSLKFDSSIGIGWPGIFLFSYLRHPPLRIKIRWTITECGGASEQGERSWFPSKQHCNHVFP